jgi:signal transduction histidine kinase
LEHDAKLNADTRREVLMIFKECLNNIARHSGGAAVEVEFDRHGEYLILQISDDGRGIEPESSGYGHGLASMSQRAKKLGAELKVTSEEGKGTTVRLEAPLRTRSHRWKNYVLV